MMNPSKTPFDYMKPDEEVIPEIQAIREAYNIAYAKLEELSDSRYKSLAITELEVSCQWAIKHLVSNGK